MGMIKVFSIYVGPLLDPQESLSAATPYVSNQFELLPEKICEPFCVSTPIGEPILAERVYRNCLISIKQNNIMVDLVELDLVDFDVILCIDWLHACYASTGCSFRVVKFKIPNEPVIE